MGTIARRVWSSKQIEVYMDWTNSFLTKTMDGANIYWLEKFDQSCYPRPSLHQKTSNTLPQQIRQQRII